MSRRSTNRLLPSGKGDIKIGRLMRTTGEKEDNGALSKSCQLENFVQIGWWIMNDPGGQHTYREFQPTWREWWSIYEAPAARLTFIDKFPKLTAFYPTDGQPFAKKSPSISTREPSSHPPPCNFNLVPRCATSDPDSSFDPIFRSTIEVKFLEWIILLLR